MTAAASSDAAQASDARPGVRHRLRGRLARPASRVLLGSLVGQGAVLAASPLITRFYGPGDLGALAVVTALSSIVGAVAPLGWDRAVVVPRAEGAARAVVLLAVVSVVTISAIAGVVAYAGRHTWAEATGTPLLVDAWWVCPVTVLAVALQRVVTSSLARRRDYTALGRRSALQGLGQVACNLALAPLGGSFGLVLGLAVGRATALVGTRRRHSPGGSRPPRATVRPPGRRRVRGRLVVAVVSRYRRFPLVSTWSGLINVMGQQAPMLLLAGLHGSPAIGALALTMRVLGSPVGIVADAVALQVDGQTGAIVRRRAGGVEASVRRVLVPLAALAGVGLVVCVLAAPVAFPVVFGETWSGAATSAMLLAPAFAAQLVASPVSRLLPLLERQGTQLAWDLVRLVATSGVIVGSSLAGATVTTSIAVWSSASVVSYAVMLGLVVRAARCADRPRAAH